ncbi:MAG TPA: S41 family peptidase [Prolixibacteraceae bacterium]|nr:S41 family peptidase [Prolixibacteraceae bacterium]
MKQLIRGLFPLFFIILSLNTFAQDVQNQSLKFGRLLRLIESYYADSTDIEKLTEVAIINLLSELDPHSVYISKDEVEKMNEPLQGSFDGIGISFSILRDTLMVIQTIPGGPSEKVGLQAGDRIHFIDNEPVAGVGLTNQVVFDKLRGEKGTLVTVKIKRKGQKGLIDFKIIRDKIPIYSLDASYMLNTQTGYIKLNRFSATTTDEFVKAISELKNNNNLQNLVLDLRGNGGGFLKSAHEISDHFLITRRMIVYTEGLKNQKKDYLATTTGEFETGRVVVLIDGGSASASEIVAGAIQDWDRGIILGRRSFGKGLVQQPFYLTDGSMIRLTTAHYYTPSGRCIQRPYTEGIDDYRNEYLERADRGELFSKDSIQIFDSIAYKTLINNRTVYGGGGIIPDVFIPVDTSSNYAYYNQLVRMSIVNQYITDYMDKNRKDILAKHPNFDSFYSSYKVSDQMLEEIWSQGDNKGIERDKKSIAFISAYAKKHIKAIIARDLWNSSEFYHVFNTDDKEILKAIEILNAPKRYNEILKGNANN